MVLYDSCKGSVITGFTNRLRLNRPFCFCQLWELNFSNSSEVLSGEATLPFMEVLLLIPSVIQCDFTCTEAFFNPLRTHLRGTPIILMTVVSMATVPFHGHIKDILTSSVASTSVLRNLTHCTEKHFMASRVTNSRSSWRPSCSACTPICCNILYYYRPWSYTEYHTEVFCSSPRDLGFDLCWNHHPQENPSSTVFSLYMRVFAFGGIADSWPHLPNWNQAFVELLHCGPLGNALQKYLDSICTSPFCSRIIRVMFWSAGRGTGEEEED